METADASDVCFLLSEACALCFCHCFGGSGCRLIRIWLALIESEFFFDDDARTFEHFSIRMISGVVKNKREIKMMGRAASTFSANVLVILRMNGSIPIEPSVVAYMRHRRTDYLKIFM